MAEIVRSARGAASEVWGELTGGYAAAPAGGGTRSLPDDETSGRAEAMYLHFRNRRCGANRTPSPGGQSADAPPDPTAAREMLVKRALTHLGLELQPLARSGAGVRRECGRLMLMLLLLYVDDDHWNASCIGMLPSRWLRPRDLQTYAEFALQCRRPDTACQLAACAYDEGGVATMSGRFGWLDHAASRMMAARRYGAALSCLQLAFGAALDIGDHDASIRTALRLASLCRSLGHLPLGIPALRQLLDIPLEHRLWCKVALHLLRLTYEAAEYEETLQFAERFRHDDRCIDVQPEVLYTAWLANRRLLRWDNESRLAADFLQVYQDHELGGEIRFAQAPDSLAAVDYRKAYGQFRDFERQYPSSPHLERVKTVLEGLGRTEPDLAGMLGSNP